MKRLTLSFPQSQGIKDRYPLVLFPDHCPMEWKEWRKWLTCSQWIIDEHKASPLILSLFHPTTRWTRIFGLWTSQSTESEIGLSHQMLEVTSGQNCHVLLLHTKFTSWMLKGMKGTYLFIYHFSNLTLSFLFLFLMEKSESGSRIVEATIDGKIVVIFTCVCTRIVYAPTTYYMSQHIFYVPRGITLLVHPVREITTQEVKNVRWELFVKTTIVGGFNEICSHLPLQNLHKSFSQAYGDVFN